MTGRTDTPAADADGPAQPATLPQAATPMCPQQPRGHVPAATRPDIAHCHMHRCNFKLKVLATTMLLVVMMAASGCIKTQSTLASHLATCEGHLTELAQMQHAQLVVSLAELQTRIIRLQEEHRAARSDTAGTTRAQQTELAQLSLAQRAHGATLTKLETHVTGLSDRLQGLQDNLNSKPEHTACPKVRECTCTPEHQPEPRSVPRNSTAPGSDTSTLTEPAPPSDQTEAAPSPVPGAPLRAPKPGDRVTVVSDYQSISDAARGPLTPGSYGTVQTVLLMSGTLRLKVKMESGKNWWYDAAALQLERSPGTRVVETARHSGSRLAVGDRVVGTSLRGDPVEGTIVEDDGSVFFPFRVQPDIGDPMWMPTSRLRRVGATSGDSEHAGAGQPQAEGDSSTGPGHRTTPGTPRRPTKGDFVTLDDGRMDLLGLGPLKPGEVGEVVEDDHSIMPYKVKAKGRTYWYFEDAVRLVPAPSSATAGADPSGSQAQSPSITVGTRVVLKHGKRHGRDAHLGPLTVTTEGTVQATDASAKGSMARVKVEDGRQWWYLERDLSVVSATPSPSPEQEQRPPASGSTGSSTLTEPSGSTPGSTPTRSQADSMPVQPAVRNMQVVRGKDWKWGDQDGGAGSKGIVIEGSSDREDGWVRVAWDNGRENVYRWGFRGKYDVMEDPLAGSR